MTLEEYKSLTETDRMRAAASALSAVAATQAVFERAQAPLAYIVECSWSDLRAADGANWVIKTDDGTTLIMKMLAEGTPPPLKKHNSEA
jgi:hypothetical protein